MYKGKFNIGDSVMVVVPKKIKALQPYNSCLGVVIDIHQNHTRQNKSIYTYSVKFINVNANGVLSFYSRELINATITYPEFINYCKIQPKIIGRTITYSIIGSQLLLNENNRRRVLIPYEDGNKWEYLDELIEKGWKLC